MRRQARRLKRRFLSKLDDTKYAVTDFISRSLSDYHYSSSSSSSSHRTAVRSSASPTISDTEDDLVFQGMDTDEGISTDDGRRTSLTMIPCEFCGLPVTREEILRHQVSCTQNAHSVGRRRNHTDGGPLRRIASERLTTAPPAIPPRMPITPTAPSAPPRSRSPSPTEGLPIPDHLKCPITLSLFRDPVVAADGHTYERSAIVSCLRTSRKSPMTREDISLNSLNPNRLVKQLADEFRAECRRKRSLYKYRLDIDMIKKELIAHLQNSTRSIYFAEWIKTNTKLSDIKIVLTHLTGTNAEHIGQVNCELGPHPNTIRTFGRVEDSDTGVLLVQEYLPEQTLANLLTSSEQKFSISILDTIFSQIVAGVRHLMNWKIFPGTINAENIFIYQLDDMLENILVKLNNLGSMNEVDRISDDAAIRDDEPGEKFYVYELGLLARELYRLEFVTNEDDSSQRESFIAHCLETNPEARPTLEELTKSLVDLMYTKKFIFH